MLQQLIIKQNAATNKVSVIFMYAVSNYKNSKSDHKSLALNLRYYI